METIAILGKFMLSKQIAVLIAHDLFLLVYSISVQEMELKREELKTDQALCILNIVYTLVNIGELIIAPPLFGYISVNKNSVTYFLSVIDSECLLLVTFFGCSSSVVFFLRMWQYAFVGKKTSCSWNKKKQKTLNLALFF